MNVSNRGIIRKLTARFLKAAKTRNVIAVVAITLTSVMFTSVFMIGGNMLAAIQDQTMRQVGTNAHGGLQYITAEQYENFSESPQIKDMSYTVILGVAENDALRKELHGVGYAEDAAAQWNFAFPSVGKMPRAANEIACGTITLDALGVPHEIGASVPLEFTVGGVKYAETFTLCGYFAGDRAMPAQQIWLSRSYVDSVLSESIVTDNFTGTINAYVWFGNAFDIEGKMRGLIAERGYSDGEIEYGVNWAYAANDISIDPTAAAIVALVLTLILLSGYLIIYSVFAISVTADIHFFGLLKTIGTTGKQIRRIVRGEALVLSAIGIPVGLLCGYFSGAALSALPLVILSVPGGDTNASPPVFVFAAVFSLLTVFIGCRKPARIAAQAVPVEAVKYSGALGSGKHKTKKTRKITPPAMAWAAVTRENRKFGITVLSLSLALILLNSAVSATKSFDPDAYLSGLLISDFAVADYSIFGNNRPKNTSGVTSDFLKEAAARGGEVSNIYYYDRDNSGETRAQVYGIGKTELANFSDIDYNALNAGNYAIVSKTVLHYDGAIQISEDSVSVPRIGDTVTLTNDKGGSREFEIIGLVDEYPHQLSVRFHFINSLDIAIADNAFIDFFGEQSPMQTNINVDAEDMPAFESWLADYTERRNADLSYISRNTLKDEFAGLTTMYLALGGSMSFILALIGVLNFVNTVAASVVARRREFAMLQSVGMTGRQLRQTLFFEGCCHAVPALIFTLTAGTGLGILIVRVIAGQAWFFKASFTVLPSVICAIPLFAICAAAPLVCYRYLARESLIERLRIE
ncbi:MAG: ABC transporter permease [Gracilibacteraceae bacterium]|jgi:putative ABC transport system permease protein|nr:ABC transporter permease [Gracilibacteraceae bacterium]